MVVVVAGCELDTEPFDSADLQAEVDALRARLDALESGCPKLTAWVGGVAQVRIYQPVEGGGGGACRYPGSDDVMVKVGDFWIDKYEMSNCAGGDRGEGPGQDTIAVACSVAGQVPQRNITWFQASAMCANAGKHVCSNAEWQTAVSGTTDPGAWPFGTCTEGAPLTGMCNTCSTGPRPTGQASAECQSRFGADDMIGNMWEWTADWWESGLRWQTIDGQPAPDRFAAGTGPWPSGYGDDQTWNVDGTASDDAPRRGLPSAAIRGGYWNTGVGAGAFALGAAMAPSEGLSTPTTRCCARSR